MNHSDVDQFCAADYGDLDTLKKLVDYNNVNEEDSYGSTVLHIASGSGQLECVRHILSLGVNVNVHAFYGGTTALHRAVSWGHVSCVVCVIDGGAEIDATDNFGLTPLYYAVNGKLENHRECARLLIDRGAILKNVKLTECLPVIPGWAVAFVASRLLCRNVVVVVIALHRYNRTCDNGVDVMRMIGKHIWSTRMDTVWNVAAV
jgi:hypothetical protein